MKCNLQGDGYSHGEFDHRPGSIVGSGHYMEALISTLKFDLSMAISIIYDPSPKHGQGIVVCCFNTI